MNSAHKKKLEKVLQCIPGYDPWAQADDCWLDYDAAAHAINWFAENLKHVEGSSRGEPFILRKWQAAIVGNIFGWKRKDDKGRIARRYRKCLILIPRGNGKTPLATGIVAYGFFCDQEPGAQCYLAAGQREQAGYLFRNLSGMIDQNPVLQGMVEIYRGDQHRSVVLKHDRLSFCKVIPAEAAGQHGGIPHITVVDELHVQENRDLVDVFETGMSKKGRSQPLLVMISTVDYDRPSICNEMEAYGKAVRDNGGQKDKPGYDPSFLPVIYQLDPDADYKDESKWIVANPNLDVSVDRDALRKTVAKAMEVPAMEATVKRLHFNMRTTSDKGLVPMHRWDACGKIEFDVEELEGRPCYAGLDLASTEDLAALSLVFPLEDERWAVLSHAWCPEDRVKRRARMRVPYDVWEKAGHIYATPGDQIQYGAIRQKFDELAKIYDIRELGYDPHGATQFAQSIQQDYGDDFVIYITQTFRNLAAPTKELIRRLKLGKVIHFNNPVLRWAASNAAAYIDGKIPDGATIDDYLDKVPIMASKRKSADKIDPFAAMVNAIARLTAHAEEFEGGSVYDGQGITYLE